jgi:hypothetical protein
MERARQHDREERAKAKASLPKFDEISDGIQDKGREISTRFEVDSGERRRDAEGPQFSKLGKVRTGTIKSGDVKVKIHLRDINVCSISNSAQHRTFLSSGELELTSVFLLSAVRCDIFNPSISSKHSSSRLLGPALCRSIHHLVHSVS